MRPTHAAPVALLLAVLAGCTTDPSPAATTVEVVDFAFVPASLEVDAGTTVTWSNGDGFAHTVTGGTRDRPAGTFDGPLGDPAVHGGQGATFAVTFDEPGTYPYVCDLHPSMTGEVVVRDR